MKTFYTYHVYITHVIHVQFTREKLPVHLLLWALYPLPERHVYILRCWISSIEGSINSEYTVYLKQIRTFNLKILFLFLDRQGRLIVQQKK